MNIPVCRVDICVDIRPGLRHGIRSALILLLLCALCAAQVKTSGAREDADLEQALSEAGSSPIEYLRAIEKHLQKYPDSPRKPELERAAFRAAIEANDAPRIVLFGERVLAREADDLQALERVTRALLADDSKEHAERALNYARRYEDLIRRMQAAGSAPGVGAADFQNQTARALGRVLVFQARACGDLGRLDEAVALAGRA
ncbi:MAG: hypothetical protein LAQ30_32755, partial [Acidobacteriia bacterium]|nr:hypothetical protein [Terriglobia bacterium]